METKERVKMFRFLGAVFSLVGAIFAGLAYPIFYREHGKYFLIFSACVGGGLLAAAGQSITMSWNL